MTHVETKHAYFTVVVKDTLSGQEYKVDLDIKVELIGDGLKLEISR